MGPGMEHPEPPAPQDSDPFERVADELESCLGDLKGLLGEVSDGSIQLDPDTGMAGLGRATRHLKQLLSLPEWPSEPQECDPAARIQAAVHDLLAQRERPPVIRVSVDPEMPTLAMAASDVDAGLEELLEIAMTHCGGDGELTIKAEQGGFGVHLSVLSVPPLGRTSERTWQMDSRLSRHVDLGHGTCDTMNLADGSLRLELQLDSVVRIAPPEPYS